MRAAVSSPETKLGRWLTDVFSVLEQAGSDGSALRVAVDAHLEGPPVLAVVGPFDAGKSSLIKRLCIDDGVPVPEGLVISGEPSTQGVDDVLIGRWLLRDTPGLDSEYEEHAGKALAAAVEADRTLLLLSPNLFADNSETAELLGALEPGTVDFVLSRADKPVMSPSPDSVSQWAAAKSSEVKELAARYGHADIAVYPVAADPRGRVGPRPAARTRFDSTRDWDGVDAIRDLLDQPCPAELRQRAVVRIARRALHEVRSSIELDLRAAERQSRAAEEAGERLQQHVQELLALENEARGDLTEQLVLAARSGSPAGARARILVAADGWLDRWSDRLGRRAHEWKLEECPWRGDLSVIGSVEGSGPAEGDESHELDEDTVEGFIAEKLGSVDGSKARVAALEGDLKGWEDAKRHHKTREFYADPDTKLNSIRDVRQAQQELLKQRRRMVGVAVGRVVLDSIREERKLSAQQQEKDRAEQVQREAAEALAVAISRVLFDGTEENGAGFRSMFDALTEQLRDARDQLKEETAQCNEEVRGLEALKGKVAALEAGPP